MVTAPTFPPFKFEPRRARIDWRLLHGIDINAMMRDVDLDTLEKIVNIVAFGDIEAEDTRHLTELNFIKIFRLSQMMIEYLLYVQDCLQSSNAWLQQDRSNMDKYVQAARLRIREIEANMKMSKRELRRARKTIKTYELLAVINDGKATAVSTAPAATATATAAPPPPAPAPPTQVIKVEANPLSAAVEALLRKELAALSDRLNKATLECQSLRSDRDELYQTVKDLEALVKSRTYMGGASSPQAQSRQNSEALQTIQGLQDQLGRATVEIAKLRNEKGDMAEDLERANSERRQLQDEKSRLLEEIASRPADRGPVALERVDAAPANDNLGSMLLDAEKQKAALQDELDEARANIAALQKQLMKAMKDTALAPLGAMPQSQASSDRAMRELEQAKAQLERELMDMRRTYTEDVRQLQEELEMIQTKAVEADRRVAELRTELAAASAQSQGTPRSSRQPSGGFVKVVEERRGGPDDYDDAEQRKRQELLSEYEAMNDRLNQQLAQLRGERNELAAEVEHLRSQPQGRVSPPPGDMSIGRDWRTEEIERLTAECDASHRRMHELEDILRDRDALIERLRNTIRDLQAQLEERNRQQQEAEVAIGRVKQQVQQFERMAGPSHHVKTSSFSFVPEELQPAISHVSETPTSGRKPPIAEQPPRSPSPRASPPQPLAAIDPSSPEFAPPSPQRPQQMLDPAQQSNWLRRIPRPTPAEAHAIQQGVLKRVVGLKPEALDMMLAEEIRVITDNPYEYEDDDEEVFRAMMPYDLAERPGVLSVKPHELQDLETARSLLTDQLLAVVDDQMAQFGLDPSADTLGDKVYAASMQELSTRRSKLLEKYPREVQERAERLRDALLTHLELMKRRAERQQAGEQQQRLQEQQLQRAAAAGAGASGSGPEIQPVHADTSDDSHHSGPAAASYRDTGRSSDVTGASAAAAPAPSAPPMPQEYGSHAPSYGRPSPPVSRDEPASAVMDVRSRPSASGGSTSGLPQPQLPAFPPPRQPSLPRSAEPSRHGSDEDLGIMLPEPGLPPPAAAPVSRQLSETSQAALSRSSVPARGPEPALGSTRVSPQGSPLERSLTRDTSISDRPAPADVSARTSRNSSLRSAQGQPSMTRSFGSSRPAPEPTTSQPPVALHLTREEPQQTPERIVLGHAKPASAAQSPSPTAAAAAPTPGGNMNMSIRSVKYQESDFDDDSDDLPSLPQPKAVTRVTAEDEYTLTEDEETQHDMGIGSDDDDISPMGSKPKIFMRSVSPTRVLSGPSNLGGQRAPTVTQSRGWATEEPLQRAPPPPEATKRPSENAEIEELESIHSFSNTSQSLSRPGAWGSPAATMRKPVTSQQGPRDVSNQLSRTSKQSGWNETIKSFGASSTPGEEAVQELTGLDSFTDTVRPMSRPGPTRNAFGAPQAGAAFGARPMAQPVAKRGSFSSDVSDMEFA